MKITTLYYLCSAIFFNACGLVYGNDVKQNASSMYNFNIIYGEDKEVCKSYLGELNASKVKEVPYCIRSIDFKNKYFSNIDCKIMDKDFMQNMNDKVKNFINYKNQNKMVNLNKNEKRAIKNSSKDGDYAEGSNNNKLGDKTKILGSMNVYGCYSSVDINNDGVADNILIWQDGLCNNIDRGASIWLITLDVSRKTIDENLMFSVLQHPDKGWKDFPNVKSFRFLTQKMGVFNYKSKTYIDGFPGIGGEGMYRHGEADLEVFLNEKGKTKLVCAYKWHGSDYND